MATLEKIRSRSVLLLVVIGVALLAFIIGDFLNSSYTLFGSGTTVAKVDGTKIEYPEYQQRYSMMSEGNPQASQMDPAFVQNQVLEQMIGEVLMNEEYEALGIYVSDKELSDYMFKQMIRMDRNFAQTLYSMIQQLQAPVELKDPSKPEQMVQDFYSFIFNPGKFGRQADESIMQVRNWWLQLEQQAEETVKQVKFQRLFGGLIVANDLDKAAIKEDLSHSYDVQYVSVPYSSLNDSDYKVSESDIQAVYAAEKERFAIDKEMRRVHYIAVPIAPSAKDIAAADTLMAKVERELAASEGVAAANKYSELSVSQKKERLAEMDAEKKGFVESAQAGAVSRVFSRPVNRTLYRLLSSASEVDSVNITTLQVVGGKAFQDKTLAALNSGKALNEVTSDSVVVMAENQSIDLLKEQLPMDVQQKIVNAGADYFVLQSVPEQGAVLCKVNSKKSNTVYTTATVSYAINASRETRDSLTNALQAYINKNNTAKAFVENAVASEQHYTAQSATINDETPALGSNIYTSVKGTSRLVQWLFKDASEGQVSQIQKDQDQLVVVALSAIYDGGYLPVTDPDVKRYCENKARDNKKAEALIKQYKGKATDINGYATLMKRPAQSLRVGGGMPTVEPALYAQAPYAQVGKAYGPVKGANGVFVYTVTKAEKAASEIGDAQVAMSFQRQFPMFQNFIEIIKENKKVENNLINFR